MTLIEWPVLWSCRFCMSEWCPNIAFHTGSAGQNKQHLVTKNTAKLDRETEELHHDRVPLEVGKVIQLGRQERGMTQKDLATVSIQTSRIYWHAQHIRVGSTAGKDVFVWICKKIVYHDYVFLWVWSKWIPSYRKFLFAWVVLLGFSLVVKQTYKLFMSNLFLRKLTRSLKSLRTMSVGEQFPTTRSWARWREQLVRIPFAKMEWSCLLCLSCQLYNPYVPRLSTTGMKLRGKDIGQPLEAKPKKKWTQSLEISPPRSHLSQLLKPEPLPRPTFKNPWKLSSSLPDPFLYLGWSHLRPAWGPGAPLHCKLHTDKSSERKQTLSWPHNQTNDRMHFSTPQTQKFCVSFHLRLLRLWHDKFNFLISDGKSF